MLLAVVFLLPCNKLIAAVPLGDCAVGSESGTENRRPFVEYQSALGFDIPICVPESRHLAVEDHGLI